MTHSDRIRDKWCEKTNLALPLRHDSTLVTAKQTDPIYNQKLNLEYNPSDQKCTRNMKRRIQEKNTKYWNSCDEIWEELNWPWVTATYKWSKGKRGIFLGVSLANQSDWICTKQKRNHGCHLHYILMEGERHTHPLCFWRDKLCGPQPHM